jgi:membrane fusion protein (multidrug efflux system)
MIPLTSIVYAPSGDSVYLLQKGGSGGARLPQARGATPRPVAPPGGPAHQRFVRLGHHEGDFVVVTSGLRKGETVVSSGAFKLKDGARVVVHNELAPHPSLHPEPPPG